MSGDIRVIRAERVVNALDDYLSARDVYKVAADQCHESHGVVIHDVVHRERSDLDRSREAFIRALVSIQAG